MGFLPVFFIPLHLSKVQLLNSVRGEVDPVVSGPMCAECACVCIGVSVHECIHTHAGAESPGLVCFHTR